METSQFPIPKKFKLSQSAGKFMLVAFWDSRGMIQAVTARYYIQVILKKKKKKKKLTENLKKLSPWPAQKDGFLLHGNAPSHTVSFTVKHQLL